MLKRTGQTLVLGAMALISLGVTACSYWYTVDESATGPTLALDIEAPAHTFTVRACMTDAFADDLQLTVIARATSEGVESGPARLALTLESPEYAMPSSSQTEVASTGTSSLVESMRVDFSGLGAVCEEGMMVTLERLDPELSGVVDVEWTVYGSAGSGNGDIQEGELVLEIR